jgi:protease-3
MKHQLAAILLGLLLVSCGSLLNVTPDVKKPITSPNDKRAYLSIRLDNGLEVVLVSDQTVDKSAAALSVGVGMLEDPETQAGMAHYLEHMLFLGTDKYPDVSEYSDFMSKNGGSNNAYTWLNITNYMFQINNESFDEALDRFSDFFKSPKLYQEYVEKEKNAVNAEYSMRREMDYFGQFSLARELFGDHPSNRFLIGNLETLADNNGTKLHEETVKFFNKHYYASNMKLVLLSNRPLSDMEKLAEQYFAEIKNKDVVKNEVDAVIPADKRGGKYIHFVPNNDVKQIILDFTIEDNSDDYLAKPNTLVTYLVGSEMPGSAASVLKEKGLISSLNAQSDPTKYINYGSISISISLTDKGMANRDEVVNTVMQYLELIKKSGVDEKYFTEVKTVFSNKFRFLEKGSAFDYVSDLAENMQLYPIADVIAAPYRFERFDSKANKKLLDQLNVNNLNIWYISKAEEADQSLKYYDGKYRLATFTPQIVKEWSADNKELSLPKINELLPSDFTIHENPITDVPNVRYDENKIKIWHYPSQLFAEQPKGVLRVFFNNAELSDAKSEVLGSIWEDLFSIEQSEMLTEAGVAGMSFSLSYGNGLELLVSGFTDKQMLLFEKGLSAIKLNVSELNFEQAIDRFIRRVQNSEKRFPYSQLFSNSVNVLRKSGVENNVLVETAKTLNREDLSTFVNAVLQRHNLRAFAFGNYSQNELEQFANKLKAIVPDSAESIEFKQRELWKPERNARLTFEKDIPVADNGLLDVYINPSPSIQNEAIAMVVGKHMGRKAFETLRTEMQLAYAVGAFNYSIRDYSSIALYIQAPTLDLPSTQQRFDEFIKDYISKVPELSAEEFNQIKDGILVSLREQPKNLSEESRPLIKDWYEEKWAFDSRQLMIGAVEKVSLEDFARYIQTVFVDESSPRLKIKLRGKTFRDVEFVNSDKEFKIDDLRQFHKTMSLQ